MSLTYLSLFSGIGGLDLGLDRAGWTCVGQVELDPFCRTVLERHWPGVARHDDVRTAPAWWLGRGTPAVDLVAGGFPCQPFSLAGRQLGTADERWGWPWFADVLRVVRPRYVLIENVPALLRFPDAFGAVLSDLHQLRFDAEWGVLSACTMGAPHTRERVFIVAYPNGLNGPSRLGADLRGSREAVKPVNGRASTWSDQVAWAVETTRINDRDADGLPAGLEPARVAALGNAVVPAVGEHFGRLIRAHAEASLATAGGAA